MTTNHRSQWERIADRIAPYQADAIEENVRDRGIEPETDEFFEACILEAHVEDLVP